MNNKPTPFNPGKVLIGSRYEAPKPKLTTEDEFWQDVFLGEHQAKRLQRVQFACYVVALSGLIFVIWSW